MTAQGFLARRRGAARAPKPLDEGWREFITPEGVDLRLKIASYGERCMAFGLDLLILLGALIVLTILTVAALWQVRDRYAEQAAGIVWMLGAFLLRNFYFVAFELRPGGATPGKRRMGLRVVARDGGRLTADAVFARNAIREMEIFVPLSFLLARGEGIDNLLIALGVIWSGVFVVFPLFNRDRLRLGDLAAGTCVVHAPKRVLRPDLVRDAPQLRLEFTPTQLDAYGEKELHVLETVLRTSDRKTVADVARRIRSKIGWPGDEPDQAFLAAYYTALRGRLERGMLLGRRRADKFDKA